MESTLPKLSGRSDLAAAMRYALAHPESLLRTTGLSGLCAASRSDARTTSLPAPMPAAKLNGLDPQAYLADVIAHISPHPTRQFADLLPYNWRSAS